HVPEWAGQLLSVLDRDGGFPLEGEQDPLGAGADDLPQVVAAVYSLDGQWVGDAGEVGVGSQHQGRVRGQYRHGDTSSGAWCGAGSACAGASALAVARRSSMASASSAVPEGDSSSVGKVRVSERCTSAVVRPSWAASSTKADSPPFPNPSSRAPTSAVARTHPS